MFTIILSFSVQCLKSRCRRKGKIFETSRKQQFILRRLRHEKFLFTRRPGASARLEIARPTATAELDFRPSIFPFDDFQCDNKRRFLRKPSLRPSDSLSSPPDTLSPRTLTESRSRAHTSIVWVQSRAFFAQDVRRVTIQKAIMNLTNDKLHCACDTHGRQRRRARRG